MILRRALTVALPEPPGPTGAAVVTCPGGPLPVSCCFQCGLHAAGLPRSPQWLLRGQDKFVQLWAIFVSQRSCLSCRLCSQTQETTCILEKNVLKHSGSPTARKGITSFHACEYKLHKCIFSSCKSWVQHATFLTVERHIETDN